MIGLAVYFWSNTQKHRYKVLRVIYDLEQSVLDRVWDVEKRVEDIEKGRPQDQTTSKQLQKKNGAAPIRLDSITMRDNIQEHLPRYSVIFNGKSVDVYTGGIRMSQIYCIAQDYFQTLRQQRQEKGKGVHFKKPSFNRSDTVDGNVPVEKMDIWPITSTSNDQPSIKRARPKTIYKRESSEIINPQETAVKGASVSAGHRKDIFPGMYLQKNIGSEGGTISILGAKLTIPAGALGPTTPILLGIVWKNEASPSLEGRQALLSPVVACEPHGLKFDQPVNLEIQHCAKMWKEWKILVKKSDTQVLEGNVLSHLTST